MNYVSLMYGLNNETFVAVKQISLTLPIGLLDAVDKAAATLYASRSDYVRQALIEQLRG